MIRMSWEVERNKNASIVYIVEQEGQVSRKDSGMFERAPLNINRHTLTHSSRTSLLLKEGILYPLP
jgi:hypothetical protein